MRFAHRFFIECLCIAALSGLVAACAQTGDDDSGSQTGTGGMFGTGGMVAGGTGGMFGTGGMVAGGTGGMVAGGTGGMVAGGTGGMTAGGTGGMTAGGTGGMTAGGTGGMTAGGTGGMGGEAGTGGGDQCVTDVTTDDPSTTADCAACLCMNCNAEVTAMKGDAKAKALLDCGKMNNCSGSCCFCGAVCDSLGGNYRMGPCAEETEMAAGLPSPSTAIDNGADLMTACGMAGNSCNKPAVLADCTAMKCMTECPPVAECK